MADNERMYVLEQRALLKRAADQEVPSHAVLIELLSGAASTHQHMRFQGQPLSKQDFLEWAEGLWDKAKENHDG